MTQIGHQMPPTHPGEILLLDFMEEHSISVTEMAELLNVSRGYLTEILKCRAPIRTDIAVKLAEIVGTSPNLWLNLQNQYDVHYALKEKKTRKHLTILHKYMTLRSRTTQRHNPKLRKLVDAITALPSPKRKKTKAVK